MEILNYTGKSVGLTNSSGQPLRVLSSNGNARFEKIHFEPVKKIDGSIIYKKQLGKVLGLPKPDPNQQKLYLVSAPIAERLKNVRYDLVVAEEAFQWEGGTFYKQLISAN